jgi:chromosome segregation ATPase
MINRDTAELSRSTLARPVSELEAQDRADLARVGERQTQLAEQVDRLKQRLHDAAKAATEAGQPLVAASNAIEQADPEAKMRQIAGQIRQNKIGEAMPRQQELVESLRKIDQTLSERPEQDLESLVARRAQAEEAIETLRKRQQELRDRTQRAQQAKAAGEQLEQLRKEQERLRDAAGESEHELRRLDSQESGQSMREAGSHMKRASEELEQGVSPSSLDEQQQALEHLDRARSQVSQSRRRAAEQLARETLVRVADELAGLAARQKTVVDETRRLQSERARRENWTRGQLRSLGATADSQRKLHDEAGAVAKRLEQAPVYAWVLRKAETQMRQASERLTRQLADAETIGLESAAWTGLRSLVDSLRTPSDPGASQGSPPQPPQATPPPSPDAIPELAELMLLKRLQEDLVRRTDELEDARQRKERPDEAIRAETQRVAAEQGELASLLERLESSGPAAAQPPKTAPKPPPKREP